MRTSVAIIVLLLALAGTAAAQDKPAGPPPVFKVVSGTDKAKGLIEFIETTTRVVPEQRAVFKEIVVVENGVQVKKLVPEVVTVYVPVTVQTKVAFDATKSRIITPDGKQLPIDEVWKRLRKGAVAVLSADGNTPAPAYLKALNQETLVIIAPQPMEILAPAINPPKLPPPPKN